MHHVMTVLVRHPSAIIVIQKVGLLRKNAIAKVASIVHPC